MEGQVYLCGWKKSRGKVGMWLIDRPELRVEGDNFEATQEALWELALDQFGDGEGVFEFKPPLPPKQAAKRFLSPHLVRVFGDSGDVVRVLGDGGNSVTGERNDLFVGEPCKVCHRSSPKRSERQLVIESVESGIHGGSTISLLGRLCYYSEDFVSLLTDSERAPFEWRPVQLKSRSRRRFLEPIPKCYVPDVPLRGLRFDNEACPECGRLLLAWSRFVSHCAIWRYVCRDALALPNPGLFAVGSPDRMGGIGMTIERWMELAGTPGTKGIMSDDLGVVDRSEVDDNPPVFFPEHREKLQSRERELSGKAWTEYQAGPVAAEMKAKRTKDGALSKRFSAETERQFTLREINKEFNFPELRRVPPSSASDWEKWLPK